MTGRNNIQAELNELNSSLPAGMQEPVFNLPKGYFENFAASVLARIKSDSARDEMAELSPLLAGIPKTTPFAVPENYFSSLQPLPAEDELPAVLKYIGKEMPYELPAGYFEEFPAQVKAALKPAKVVTMRRSWSRMAVAAMTAGIITLGSFLYFGNRAAGPSVDSPAWVSAKLDKVSDKGLEEFIKATDAAGDQKLASNDVRIQDVKAMLSDVTVNDMDAFLNELPEDEEDPTVIN
jgi:hypothetical protein